MKNTNLIVNKISTGKTRGLMFDETNKAIKNKESLVIVDNKEEYYRTFAPKLKEEGYEINVINLKDPTHSNGFNPLKYPFTLYNNNKKDLAIKIINDMAKELTYSEEVSDPFWTNSAADYLTGLCLTLFNNAKPEEINFGSIQTMLSELDKEDSFFIDYVKSLSVISSEYIYLSATSLAPIDTKGGIISVLKTELNKYIGSEGLLNLLSNNDLDLITSNKKAIFIIGNERYSKLVNIMIDELNTTNHKYTYIIDNADSLTKIQCLSEMLEEASIKENKIYFVSRNIDLVKERYGKYITDLFAEITDTLPKNINTLGNYKEYPVISINNSKYFSLKSIIK